MKKLITLTVMISAIILLFSTMLNSLPKKPPKAKTGAPGEGTCADCHMGAGLDMGPGYVILAFSGSGNKYKVGKNYTVTVSVYDTTKTRFGFETVSVDVNNNQAGTPSETDKVNTTLQKDDVTGKRYISNYTGTGLNVWSYKWKAPSFNMGDIKFYGTGNATNWNDALDGDNVYSASMIVKYKASNKLDEITDEAESTSEQYFSIYPNPVTSVYFNASFYLESEKLISIEIYSLQGRYLQTLFQGIKEEGQHDQAIHLMKQVPTGIYLISLSSGSERIFRKVVFGL